MGRDLGSHAQSQRQLPGLRGVGGRQAQRLSRRNRPGHLPTEKEGSGPRPENQSETVSRKGVQTLLEK